MVMAKPKLPLIYLKPGEIYVTTKPTVVTTVLGSCISVVMYCRRFRMGAISHGILPDRDNTKNESPQESLKYVESSIRHMVAKFDMAGVKRNEIEVKLFGGADMFSTNSVTEKGTVGKQNIKAALQALEIANLRVQNVDAGGNRGRKLFFFTHTGEVFLKHL